MICRDAKIFASASGRHPRRMGHTVLWNDAAPRCQARRMANPQHSIRQRVQNFPYNYMYINVLTNYY